MTPESPEPPRTPRRKPLWYLFWFVFLLTPAAVILLPVILDHFPQLNVMGDYGLFAAGSSLLAGSFASAFLLARIYSTTTTQIVLRTIGFGVGFTVLLGAISFAGCMAGFRG